MLLEHPYDGLDNITPLRGNLHAHTTQSDGTRSMQEVVDDYAQRGYDFLMISDHDIFTGCDAYAQVDARGMTLIPGNEISRGARHLLHVNADRFVPNLVPRQAAINKANEARGFLIACHPNWQESFDSTTITQLREWVGYVGIEIYNGVIGVLNGSPYALDKWDILLSEGRKVWGFANDDSHRPGDMQVGLGWNMVYADSRTPDAIAAAMEQGRFYASTGVTIDRIEVDGMTVRIEAQNADRIAISQTYGRRIAQVDSQTIEFTVPEDAGYIRVTCWGRGEACAWTQPFFVVNEN